MNILTLAIPTQVRRDRNELAVVRDANWEDLNASPLLFIQLDNEIIRLNNVYNIVDENEGESLVIFTESPASFLTDTNTTLTVGETDYIINLINIEVEV